MSEPIWRRVLRMHGADPQTDVREEFSFHIDERTEALIAKGMMEGDARALAVRQFGDLQGAVTTCSKIGERRMRRIHWQEMLSSVTQDLAYAMRAIRRSPGFTVSAVATIALGIGANTAVFSLLNALILRPLDATNPGELVRIYTSQGHAIRDDRDKFGSSSYADYLDLRRSRSLDGLAATVPVGTSVQLKSSLTRLEGRVVSENYFAVLGRPLFVGGWRSDGLADGAPAVVVSHQFWTAKLDGDPAVVGHSLMVNGRPFQIAGVASPAFKGIEPSNVDLYFPFQSARELIGREGFLVDRAERSVKLIGRLAAGATPQSAEQEVNGIMQALAADFPLSNAKRIISVRPATSIVALELMGSSVYPIAGLVFAATLVVLAISGVNVAAVLLTRTISRKREIAVRMSLGASPFRLVRQLVTESVMLAAMAGIAVVALIALLPVLAQQLGVPQSVQPSVDASVLAYAALVTLGFGVAFGLAPAFVGTRTDVVESLRGGQSNSRPVKARVQRLLVCSQLALSMLLLMVGGGFLASLNSQQKIDPGFSVEQLVVANFEDPLGVSDAARLQTFTDMTLTRLRQIPGVTSIAIASMAPLTSDGVRSTIHIPGYAEQPDEDMQIAMVTASPDFFRTLRIPLRRGRELTWSDHDTLSRVVINESMALRYWGQRNPVGTFVNLGGGGGRAAEVIGVAADARFISLSEAPKPMYVVQKAVAGGESVLIRTGTSAASLLLPVRGLMSRNEVPLTLVQLRTMYEILNESLLVARAVTDTLMTIGIVAILLAAVGLYGVVSYVMAGRTREFGVRLALGATHASITRLVVGYGLQMAVIGGGVGIVLGQGALAAMGGILGASSVSVSIAFLVAVALAAVTLIACAIPASKAIAIAPASAMRSE